MKRLTLAAVVLSACSLVACQTSRGVGEEGGAKTNDPGARASSRPSGAAPELPSSTSSAGAATTASAASSAQVAPSAGPSASASSSAAADAPPPPCPDDMVLVGRTCVDRFEAFLKEPDADGKLFDHPYFERPQPGVKYVAANEVGKFPQGYISRVESKAACEGAGKRLCSKGEWTRACKNKGYMTYPYGQRGISGKCNTGKIHLLSQMFKHPQGGFKYEDHFNSPELNKTPDFLAKSGQFDGCASDLGVFDMIGNLHEWVSDTVDQDLMDKLDEEPVERRKQPWREGNGVFMGGFYSTTSEHGPGCFFITVAHEPAYHDYSTGFRCCKTAVLPKPEKPKPKKPAKK